MHDHNVQSSPVVCPIAWSTVSTAALRLRSTIKDTELQSDDNRWSYNLNKYFTTGTAKVVNEYFVPLNNV